VDKSHGHFRGFQMTGFILPGCKKVLLCVETLFGIKFVLRVPISPLFRFTGPANLIRQNEFQTHLLGEINVVQCTIGKYGVIYC
jgi:hypothetical protein